MKKKALRMQRTDRHIDRQLRIISFYDVKLDEDRKARGRFRKQNVLDCGRPRCCLCGNPRHKGWDHGLTFQELKSKEAMDYDLDHLYDDDA
jgi:hypothetical protein